MSETQVWTPIALPGYMQHRPIYDALATWMQPLTLDIVIELWWESQRRRAEKEEHNAARCADPFDYYAKPSGYVMPQREVTP